MAISSFTRSGLSRVTSPGNAVISGTPTGTYSSGGKNYAYFSFTGNGTLTVNSGGLADVLVVGGGGYSYVINGTYRGGGGGGGVIYKTGLFLDAGSYTVTVGGGGDSAGVSPEEYGGSPSSIAGLTAIGGGNGTNSGSPVRGGWGGSGGGSSGAGSGGLGITGQGNKGGYSASGFAAGGGAGGAGSGSTAGPGVANSITGSSVTYAKGGDSTTTNTANSGNGRGGSDGNGNSGIVIVRVEV